MNIYIYLYIYIYSVNIYIYFAIHLKLTQHCKSTILQKKMVKVFHYIYDKEYSRKSSHKPHHVRVSNVTIVNNNLKNLNKILCSLGKKHIWKSLYREIKTKFG